MMMLPGARALTVAMLNDKLDEIVGSDGGAGKKETLRYLMHMCGARHRLRPCD